MIYKNKSFFRQSDLKTSKKNKTKKHKKAKKRKTFKNKKTKNMVFIDVGIDGKKIGRIVIKLFDDVVPLTCKNFKTLCENKSYVGSTFHRIVKNFIIQGGDYTNGDGTGGKSIYGKTFNDENFKLKHNKPYLLSMANKGKNTNGSQFFITLAPAKYLDMKHVVFGEVVNGFEIIDKLNCVQVINEKPIDDIFIVGSGILKK